MPGYKTYGYATRDQQFYPLFFNFYIYGGWFLNKYDICSDLYANKLKIYNLVNSLVQSSAEKVYRKFVQLKLASCGLNTRQRLYRCGLCGGDKSIPFHFQRNEVDLNDKITDITTTDIFQEQEVQYRSLQATVQYHFPYSFLASFIYFFSLRVV